LTLKPCTGCGKRVDTRAKVCPGCRRFLPTTSNAMKGLAAAVVLGFAVLFASALFQIVRSLGSFGSPGSPGPRPAAHPGSAVQPAGPRSEAGAADATRPRKSAPSRW
jgi:hypothetical protein